MVDIYNPIKKISPKPFYNFFDYEHSFLLSCYHDLVHGLDD